MMARRLFQLLPAPLMSRARRAGPNPFFEGMGRGGVLFFCPVGQRPKVGGGSARNWWILGMICAKSLIVEQNCSINCGVLSIICRPASIICAVLSIRPFSAPRPSFSLFSFCKQRRRRRERHPSEDRGNPPVEKQAYSSCGLLAVGFCGFWWIVVDGKCLIVWLFIRFVVISTIPAVFCAPPSFFGFLGVFGLAGSVSPSVILGLYCCLLIWFSGVMMLRCGNG